MRKNYYLMIDTETCGTLDDAYTYDIGCAVIDKTGKVYAQYSFVVAEIFFGMTELMKSAYYASKIPDYWRDIETGKRRVARLYTIQAIINMLCARYHITAIIAHNMRFDYNALNNTIRAVSNGAIARFLPHNVQIWCTLAMARSLMTQSTTYQKYCQENGYVRSNGQPRCTAEILYRFITHDNSFNEKHTGIDDVMIEKEIFAYFMRKHKKMQKTYWKEKE